MIKQEGIGKSSIGGIQWHIFVGDNPVDSENAKHMTELSKLSNYQSWKNFSIEYVIKSSTDKWLKETYEDFCILDKKITKELFNK